MVGIFISFNTHKHITFLSNSKKFKIYILFALLFYLITNGLLFLADSYSVNIYLSYLFILFPIAICNFFILRRFIFNSWVFLRWYSIPKGFWYLFVFFCLTYFYCHGILIIYHLLKVGSYWQENLSIRAIYLILIFMHI